MLTATGPELHDRPHSPSGIARAIITPTCRRITRSASTTCRSAEHGYIEIPMEDGTTKKIRILRAHLEEDAGKNIHTLGNFSAVDLNRAGTPLLEIVTEPDMNSPVEVRLLAQELQRIVRFLGVSEADMQKGHMRFEPNINLHITRDGQVFKTPITEVKNLNSFRAMERSIAYEIKSAAR